MKVYINSAQLLETASFIHRENDVVKIVINDQVEGDMEFDFKFIKGETNEKPLITYLPKDKFKAIIEFKNIGSWVSTKELVPLGTYQNENRLSLHCISKAINENLRETNIMFYIERK